MKMVLLSILLIMVVAGTAAAQTPEELIERAIDSHNGEKAFELIDKGLLKNKLYN